MAFLPDGRLLVTEQRGALKLYTPGRREASTFAACPQVSWFGQGGFGDVVLHPDFANNGLVYLSYAEAGEGETRGAAVARAKLALDGNGGELQNLQVIWRQVAEGRRRRPLQPPHRVRRRLSLDQLRRPPEVRSRAGHERRTSARCCASNEDGCVPRDNPFADRGGVTAQIWSLGHRNLLGLAFDAQGRLWDVEMGPMGGDELNQVRRGANYGYPIVQQRRSLRRQGHSRSRHAARVRGARPSGGTP